MDVEIVTPQFGHYVKLASMLAILGELVVVVQQEKTIMGDQGCHDSRNLVVT